VNNFSSFDEVDGFRLKLWRGESMALLGFDVDEPEDDFVGFAVEYREPGSAEFLNLRNRLSFDPSANVNGFRNFPTLEAPLQTYRWVHFPFEPRKGTYTYRVTKMHMPTDGTLRKGHAIELPIDLDPVTIDDFVDIGFTRNFASSQAFEDKKDRLGITDQTPIIPADADDGLAFAAQKAAIASKDENIYEWLGFEAARLLFEFLDEAIGDPAVTVDAMAYDLNEPDIVARLERLGARLRIIIDDSDDHGSAASAESASAERLKSSAGAANVHRGHFNNLQHNKVFIAKRHGVPVRILGGSTNFSFRGLYIQANNLYVFRDRDITQLFADMFDLAFTGMDTFSSDEFSKVWHVVKKQGRPTVHVCFSPHTSSDLSLSPVGGAIEQATSSVFYSFAFMNITKTGPVRKALNNLIHKPLFSYGVVDKASGMEVKKPSGEVGLVDFAFLSKNAPEPFKAEWSGGRGINIHHKFAVIDFDQPTAKVFTGSSNFSPSGENNNGDHLLMIEDQRIATVYAIEALRVFDHLNFRVRMKNATPSRRAGVRAKPDPLHLKKPIVISGEDEAWFDKFYVPGSQRERDRKTFSRRQ
jgi:phosphatidylserine/phosphatidylglycerophosphate/cardiolipin synthase-like enzyme